LQPNEEKLKEDKYAGVNQITAQCLMTRKSYNEKNWDAAYANLKTWLS
jgi:hypothetical protein